MSQGDDVRSDSSNQSYCHCRYRRSRVTYRRERSTRDVYEERFIPERAMPYPRAAGTAERRGPFGRPEEDYGRGGYEYEGAPRYFPNGGGPRNYHAEEQRGYHGDSLHFSAERRGGPPPRREEYPYRVPRDDPHPARTVEFGEDREAYRRKAAPFPPIRERSPARRTDVPRSPHSRSGSSVSSRSYSPDRTKALPFTPQQGKDKVPCLSRDVSPQSTPSIKEEVHPVEAEREEPAAVPIAPVEELHKTSADDFQERRAHAIATKARDIEKVYRQDCETFGMVVKMLVAKDPNLEKQLQVPLRENLGEIRERCLEDLKHFISELDEAVRQPEKLA
ncbi:unnamed protein product [Lota lota]